ncbi:nitroreductase family protein [Jeotgalibaca caeni]|uniref:nitroreductase family protein n=1 Tax=Jeotgalibaca caeni TaxID=3028623 RepID=UPI00237D9DA9|nr:nitroreductase family protein [Jeotgalibaca caeni]MDE1549264.1 nitroreductase family protein [Jeotgalibaca caeni]
MSQFTDLVKSRRTRYAIGNNTDLSKEEIVARIREVAREVPTASNSQTTRLVVVFGEENARLWDHILDVQKDVLQGEMWDMMSGVMQGAKGAVGTVLFFEDLDAVAKMPAEGAREEAYKQNNNANSQYAIWLALTELGLGASLQHMNIGHEQGFDKSVLEMFNLPENYEMIAQMPFGSIEGDAFPKEYIEDEVRVQVIG